MCRISAALQYEGMHSCVKMIAGCKELFKKMTSKRRVDLY